MSRLFRVPLEGLEPGERVLEAGPARYVARVHRLGRGDRFVAFDPEQAIEADAEVVEASRHRVRCRIAALRRSDAVPSFDLTLLHAIGKADKPDRVIRDATALGARRVVFVESARAVVRISDAPARRQKRWRVIAVEAARQSGRGDVPSIAGPLPLAAALREQAVRDSVRLLLDAAASASLGERLAQWKPAQGITVLIGPEGGFDETERQSAIREAFEPVSLGQFVLRTETAVTACLGAIAAFAKTPT